VKEKDIESDGECPIFRDDEGREYSYVGAFNDSVEDILKEIDSLLIPFGLEIYSGNAGSSDYFVTIEKRVNEEKEK